MSRCKTWLIPLLAVATMLVASSSSRVQADPPSFLRLFGKKKVEADPAKDYKLTEVEGPWMIFAATFTGENGARNAHQLVLELRSQHNLPAFVYKEKFDFSQPIGTQQTNHRPLRYANDQRFDAYAVLVGEFDSVNHPEVEKTLETVKSISPRVFNAARPEDEVGAMTTIRRIKNQILNANKDGEVKRGPMYNAFVTRNPMLPESFTQAPEVDSFVRSLNDGVKHSLLDCPGKYTVIVRTFEGLSTTMLGGKIKKDIEPDKDRLDEGAAYAHKMVQELREKGVEAYEFHDRTKSIVTVGSFDSLGENSPNGFHYSPQIQNIMRNYSGVEMFGKNPQGQVVKYTNNIAGIPYDPAPRPIAVPKATKRSFYSAAFNR